MLDDTLVESKRFISLSVETSSVDDATRDVHSSLQQSARGSRTRPYILLLRSSHLLITTRQSPSDSRESHYFTPTCDKTSTDWRTFWRNTHCCRCFSTLFLLRKVARLVFSFMCYFSSRSSSAPSSRLDEDFSKALPPQAVFIN